MKIVTEYDMVSNYPLQMLNMALNECLEDLRGLCPQSEIKELINLTDKIDIKEYSPKDDWICHEKIGTGGEAQVFKVEHKRSGRTAAIKRFENVTP